MSEQKNPYTANWVIKKNNKHFVPGVNDKPLYLSKDEAEPLLDIGAIIKFENEPNKLS
jgi:hypothetical protein